MQYLGVQSSESSAPPGEFQSGCMIPQICYEPVNNWMKKTAASATAGDVYWTELTGLQSPGSAATVATPTTAATAAVPPSPGIPYVFKNIIMNRPSFPRTIQPQSWVDEQYNVQSSQYSDAWYRESGLGFDTSKPPPVMSSGPTASSSSATEPSSPESNSTSPSGR